MKRIYVLLVGLCVVLTPVTAGARDRGGAIAAGIIGGLALGIIAHEAYRPRYYAQPYGGRHYAPAYYSGRTYCRDFVNQWGQIYQRCKTVYY